MAAESEKTNVITSTDLTKWRLKNERGRQTWWYDVNGDFERDSNFPELHSLGLDTVSHLCIYFFQDVFYLILELASTSFATCIYS